MADRLSLFCLCLLGGKQAVAITDFSFEIIHSTQGTEHGFMSRRKFLLGPEKLVGAHQMNQLVKSILGKGSKGLLGARTHRICVAKTNCSGKMNSLARPGHTEGFAWGSPAGG